MLLKKNLIYIAAIVTTIIYAIWRAVATLPWGMGLPALITGILLLVAEIVGSLKQPSIYQEWLTALNQIVRRFQRKNIRKWMC